MAEDKSNKTEKATPQRLKKAREEGNIPRTQDLSMWLTVLVFVVLGPSAVSGLYEEVHHQLRWATHLIAAPDISQVLAYLRSGLTAYLVIIAPITLSCMLLGALGHVVQGGVAIHGKRFKPKWRKLNPLTGVKNLFGAQAAWTFVKTLLKFGIFGLIAYTVVNGTIRQITGSGQWALRTVVDVTTDAAMRVILWIAVIGLLIAAADYTVERRRVGKSLRMSKDEVRREHKQQEGDPHVKGQRRAKQRELGRRRMMAAVGESTVVLTNPAHVAVALKYAQGLGAPQVVAKGAGYLAARIKQEAQAHDVPIVRDVIVARMLYKLCEVDSYIPVELYEAIAQVLAFVMRMSDLRRAADTHDSPLRHPGFNGTDLPEDLTDEALGITAHDAAQAGRAGAG